MSDLTNIFGLKSNRISEQKLLGGPNFFLQIA